MRNINNQMVSEQTDWSQLRVLEHVPAPTPDMLFNLNLALQEARYADWRITGWIEQLEEPARKLKLRKRGVRATRRRPGALARYHPAHAVVMPSFPGVQTVCASGTRYSNVQMAGTGLLC